MHIVSSKINERIRHIPNLRLSLLNFLTCLHSNSFARVDYEGVGNGYDLERFVPIIIPPMRCSWKYRYYVSPPHSPHLLTWVLFFFFLFLPWSLWSAPWVPSKQKIIFESLRTPRENYTQFFLFNYCSVL